MPDTSKLPVIKFEDMLALKVTDAASCTIAATNKDLAKDYIASVELAFAKPKAGAFAAHKSICALEKQFLGSAPAVVEHCVRQADAWTKGERQKQEALVREVQRQQLEAARKLQAEAEAAKQKEIDDAMPWDDMPTPEVMPMRIPDPAPINLPPVKATGFNEKFKPWSFRVKTTDAEGDPVDGLMDLVKAIAAGKVPLRDEFGTPILELSQAHFKNAAKRLEGDLEKRYPGVEGYRETSLS